MSKLKVFMVLPLILNNYMDNIPVREKAPYKSKAQRKAEKKAKKRAKKKAAWGYYIDE